MKGKSEAGITGKTSIKLFHFIYIVLASLLFFRCDVLDSGGDDDGLSWIENDNGTVDATIYYVSTNGDDSSDGTTIASAFRTILHALNTVHPGGTIRIMPGTYNEAIGSEGTGSAAAPIIVEGHQGIPVLDGEMSRTMAFWFENSNNLIFRNLEIKRYTDVGIGFSYCNTITLRNIVVHHDGNAVQLVDWEFEGYGIHVEESEHVLIDSCEAYECGPNPQIFPDFLMGTGINTYGNKNVVISNCLAHHNTGGGMLIEDSEDALVQGNEVYANDVDATDDEWWDAGIWLDGGHDVIIKENEIYENLGPGIQISDEDDQNPYGYVLEDNVIERNYFGVLIWGFGTTDWPDPTIITRSGNQIADNTRQDIKICPDFCY